MSKRGRLKAIRRVVEALDKAKDTGLCPVCNKRPSGTWKSGVNHVTCGDPHCFESWIGIRRSQQKMEHTSEYTEYLKSSHWETKRRRWIMLADNKCQRCGISNVTLECHHLTYDNLYYELDEDILVVCHQCHQEADSERRGAAALRAQRALDDARLNGWATKVYGEDWIYMDEREIQQEFDDWLESKEE